MATHSSILSWKISWTGEPGSRRESETTEHTAHTLRVYHVLISVLCILSSSTLFGVSLIALIFFFFFFKMNL